MTVVKRILGFAFLALLMSMPLQADEHEKESIASVVTITPKAGHADDLLEAITEYHHWIADFEGHMQYNWFEILTGPDTGKFAARTGSHSWADFDAEYDWQEQAGEKFAEIVAPHIESVERAMTSEMTEMSHWPENWDGYSLFYVQQWYVHNGKGAQFRKGLKKIVETLKAGGYPGYFGFHSVESGGHGNQITIVSPKKGWAGFSEQSPSFYEIMKKELGGEAEFENFMSEWSATFKTGGSQTVKYLKEASDYGK